MSCPERAAVLEGYFGLFGVTEGTLSAAKRSLRLGGTPLDIIRYVCAS
ncbi:hypothetical protein HNQ92_004766 [Rhabdobacter roseus]|uniref:Uncharacterized protein n=1 Tax=Rhabdobacter roseus TaxID=1655419 RepID=A0A840TUL9_9BACT|nr:hypothetical protein [Rhabdobacter roseus]MBB5286605.1 hypothetical protein [Rhabdobacter roseus]